MKQMQMLSASDLQKLFVKTIFSPLDAMSIEKFQPLLERKLVQRGENIRTAQKDCGDLFIVESGKFALSDADHSIIATKGVGECIGVLSAMFGGPQLLDTVAMEDSVVIHLDAGSLKMLNFSEPLLSLKILQCMRNALSPFINDNLKLLLKLYKS